MVSESIAVLAIIAASTGAILSTLTGWWGKQTDYKKGKLASSLIIAVFGSFALLNFEIISDQLTNVGLVGLAVTYLLLGFGVDKGLSKLDS